MKIEPLPAKGCEFVFQGGPRDGQVERCQRPGTIAPNILEAEGLWMMTRGGQVGRGFRGLSPGYLDAFRTQAVLHDDGTIEGIGPAQSHMYQVVSREDANGVARVICEYKGTQE